MGSQRARNVSGISLDFVLDTAANINTLNAQVAQELNLSVVGEAPAGLAAGGYMDGGNTYMLGDCELEGLDKIPKGEDSFTFMTNLTASVVPIANPASAGILSLAFFYCFAGGVEFSWGQGIQEGQNANMTAVPSVTFHGDEKTIQIEDRLKTTITPVPVTLLPSITIKVNGVEMPALLDTGSPITVLNTNAAKVAGVETMVTMPEQGRNIFSNFANNFRLAQAASRGEVLTLAGSDGQPVNLLKSKTTGNEVVVVADDGSNIDFNSNIPLFVGDFPGLAALNGIGVDSPPAVVLGTDILRRRPNMLLRGQQNEVYF